MDKIIYAILSVKEDPEKLMAQLNTMKGILEADLYIVSYEDISAVVSDINRSDLIADKTNALKFAELIENLAEQFTVIPVRFGSLVESSDRIKKMLERNYNKIQNNLLEIKNKVEFGLKVFCDPEKMKAEIKIKAEAEPLIESIKSKKKSIYTDYLLNKLKEHRFEEQLLAHVDCIILDITTHLKQLNPIQKFKKMVSATNIIDAVLLLEKDKKELCINVVNELQNKYPDLSFMLTGPWPPYNFVDINIK